MSAILWNCPTSSSSDFPKSFSPHFYPIFCTLAISCLSKHCTTSETFVVDEHGRRTYPPAIRIAGCTLQIFNKDWVFLGPRHVYLETERKN
jgi:hypothetical protein